MWAIAMNEDIRLFYISKELYGTLTARDVAFGV